MALGTAIVLSVILLILAWQVERRGAWNKIGKVFLWIAVAAIVVGAGIWA